MMTVHGSAVRGAAMRESVRRAAECALLGVVWTVFSLPLVTAGAAWAAVAEVCACWHRAEEPPLVTTFAAVVRREFAAGTAMAIAGLAAAALPALELRVTLAARVPGARVEAAALAVVGGVALSLVLLTFPQRSATGEPWTRCVRTVVSLASARLWVVPLTAVAVAVAGFLVVVYPPLILMIAGPVGYAVSAVHARALAGTPGRLSPGRKEGSDWPAMHP